MRIVAGSLIATACLLLVASPAVANTKVTVSNVHLCCGACITGVKKALADLEGVSHVSDRKAKTVAITADNDEAAQKAINALSKAGFYGKTNSETIKYKPVETPKGNVERLALSTHNCCGACTSAIKKAMNTVDGVAGSNIKPRNDEFVVEGNFKAAALVEALLDAGFAVQLKK